MFSNQMKGVLFDYGSPASLNRIGIVGNVACRRFGIVCIAAAAPSIRMARGRHKARHALSNRTLVASS
jgi:hypothetical protein